MLKFSISGVRGIVDESLTPKVVLNFAKAFGTLINDGSIAIASDTRPSSEFLKGIVSQGLLSTGCTIIDLGILPTPTIATIIKEEKISGGIMVTASHNPEKWNGLKFLKNEGIFINENENKKLWEIYESKNFLEKNGGKIKYIKNPWKIHFKRIFKAINRSLIKKRKFKVAIDSCNSAGSKVTIEFLKELGCEVFPINCEIGKHFPRGAEPKPENLDMLKELVLGKKADIGFAQDPDADRLGIVTNEGIAISEEYTLLLAADFILGRNNTNKIAVANLSTSQALDEIARKHKALLLRTKIGEVYVSEEIRKTNALIGGEGNGGVIFPKVNFNRDSLTAIALILNYMAKTKMKISQIISKFPSYSLAKEKIAFKDDAQAERILNKVKDMYKNNTQILTEGVKVLFKNSWIHVRPSNTEPIIRLFAEAKNPEEAKELIRKTIDNLQM